MIRINNVTMKYPRPKRYREYLTHPFSKRERLTALESINLTIEQGDRVAFLGPNGAGKTSLLKLIGGLLLPTEGSISINSNDTITNNEITRKSVGYVINEERSFYWRLTGFQNLEFFGSLENLSGSQLRNRIDLLFDLVGLKAVAHKRVEAYSSGMKQRLAIARGLLVEPYVLILDEPTRNFDPAAADELCDLIINQIYSKSFITLLIATHILEMIPRLCTSVCLLKDQRISFYDTVDNILSEFSTLNRFYRIKA